MKKFIIYPLFIFVIILNVYSSNTKFFRLTKAQTFNKGEKEKVTITEEGFLRLSEAIDKLHDKNDLLVNDVSKDKNGNVYIATGNNGKLYKKTPDGKSKVFFKASGFNVVSVTTTNKGVYAAVLPESEVWFIDFKGNAKKIAAFKEKYIWQILSHPTGDIYVVCGDEAALYKINNNNEKSLIYKNPHDNHFQALDIYKNKVYFVSEGIGALYEYNITNNKTKVIYETYEKEITSVAVNEKGEVFFVTGKAAKLKLPRNSFDYTDTFVRQSKGSKKFSKNAKYLKNSVYVYNKDKKINKIFTKNNFIFHSIAVMKDNEIYIGSGTMGIIFKIEQDGRAYYSYRLKENQILCLKKLSKGNVFVGTGNPGKLYKISSKYAKKGVYTSTVYNAKATSNWGKINVKGDFPASTDISFETRTGETSRPDNTWSKWQKCGKGFRIKSPASKYIQFRLTLKTTNPQVTPVIRRILIPFLRYNRQPKITNIKFKRGVANKKTGGKDYTICNLSWNAFDPDHDTLWYRVFIKRVGNKKWKRVLRKTRKLNVTFDSRMFPDGKYLFKVIAFDSMRNSVGVSKSGQKISQPITIDNSKPYIKNMSITKVSNGWLLKFTAIDDESMIGRCQVTVNYGEWKTIMPADGMYDEKSEKFQYILTKSNHKKIEKGENVVIIKIIDFSGNLVSLETRFVD